MKKGYTIMLKKLGLVAAQSVGCIAQSHCGCTACVSAVLALTITL